MIFMSQSGLLDPARDADWDAWYVEHLRVMVSVQGVGSAQRFKTSTPHHPPSLAVYSMESAAVFEDPYYLSIRGLGEFRALVDTRFYRRNLFAGLDRAPAAAEGRALLVWDAASPQQAPGWELTWLEAVAVDRSTPYRGIALIDAYRSAEVPVGPGIAIYTPVTGVFHK